MSEAAELRVVEATTVAHPVTELASDELERDLVRLAGRLASSTYELLVRVGEFDRRNTWALRGALSCAAWLAELCGIRLSTARAQVRVGRALREHHLLDAALRDGEISYSKARSLVPHLDGDNDAELIDIARTVPAGRLGTAIATWCRANEDGDVIDRRQRDTRSCSWRTNPDGTVTVTARLTPAAAGVVCAVIDGQVAVNQPADDEPGGRPRLAQQRADALVELLGGSAGAFGSGDPETPSAAAVTCEVIVHVTEDGNQLPDGTPLGDHAVASMLPDSFVSLLVHDSARQPVDASPRRRLPTRRQRRIIDRIHPECAHPGCHARSFLQYDHIRPYTRGGDTVVANLQRLCGPHNRSKGTGESM